MPSFCLNRSRLCFVVFVIALFASQFAHAIPIAITYQDAFGTGFFDNTPVSPVGGNPGTTLGAQRRNAFETAMAQWGDLVNGSVTVHVQAAWASQAPSLLAQAFALGYFQNFPGAPRTNVIYPSILANQLAGSDQDTSTADVQVNCNLNWPSWYYGLDGNGPDTEHDFIGVILHEFNHGLGFTSLIDSSGQNVGNFPYIYDTFLVNLSGTPLEAMSPAQRAAALVSENLYSFGSNVQDLNAGSGVKIFAPSTFQNGGTAKHLDEDLYSTTGSVNELMTPYISFSTHNIGPQVFAVLRDIGYTFADTTPPTATFTGVTNGAVFSSLPQVTGTASDGNNFSDSGLLEVRVALARLSDGVWWNWKNSTWGTTTFDFSKNYSAATVKNVPVPHGTLKWTNSMPSLADGAYQVQVSAVDLLNQGSSWVSRTFTIDSVEPTISFSPLTNNAVVFDFSSIGGSVSKPSTVTFTIADITDGIANTKLWNGSGWTTNASDPNVNRPAVVSSLQWSPAGGLPPRSQIRQGSYAILAQAEDLAGNSVSAGITVTRSPADTTFPNVAITVPASGTVLTNNAMTGLMGTADDPETGIASVSVFLTRFDGSQFLYWTGSSWSTDPQTVPTSYSSVSHIWQSTSALPSGSNLPNGTYEIQASAQNGENPGATKGVSSSFIADYHPVYVWTEGSYSDGISGNENHNWNNPANWDRNAVPTTDSAVVIANGTCDATTSGYLNVYRLNVTGGSLTTTGMTVKFLNVSSGTLAANGTVQLDTNGRFVWSGGTLQPGTFNIPATGVLTMTNSATKALYDATINNSGTIVWTGGSVYGQHAWFVNGPSGVFDAQADATLNLYPNFGDGVRGFTNYGVFRKTAGTEALHQGSFYNYGQIDVQTGSVALYDYVSLRDGSTITGSGKVRTITGCCGNVTEVFGTTTINGTLEFSENNTRLRGYGPATVTLGAAGKIRLLDGHLGGDLTFNGTGIIEWNGGSFDGTNTISAQVTVNAAGSYTKYLGSAAVLNNLGTVNWGGTGQLFQDGRSAYGYSPAVFNNLNGATFNVTNEGAVFGHYGDPSRFNNFLGATFVKQGNTNVSYVSDFHFSNDGTIQCNTGTLHFSDVNAQTLLNNGSTLSGNGAIKLEGDVRLSGTINSQCQVELAGNNFTGTTNQPTYSGSGLFKWTGGNINGTVDFASNVTVQTAGSGTKYLGSAATLNNHGTFIWTGTGSIYNYGRSAYAEVPATFNNFAGAQFIARTNGTIFNYSGSASTFNNLAGASFLKDGDTNVTWFGNFDLNNYGTVEATAGALEFYATVSLKPDCTLKGSGEIRQNGGIFSINGTNIIDHVLFKMTGGEMVGMAVSSGTLQTTNGGVFEWNAGTISQTLQFGTNCTVNITGSSTKYFSSGANLNNRGNVTWTGTGDIFNYGRSNYGETPASWNNFGGSTFTALNDAAFQYSGSPSVFNNLPGAVFQKTGGTNATTVAWMFNNAGLARATTGRIDFSGDGSDVGTYDVSSGAVIRFNGGMRVFAGTTQLIGDGKIQLDGTTINANGSVTFGTNGVPTVLEIISGTLQGTASFAGTPIWNWQTGTIAGELTVPATTVLNISGSGTKMMGSGAVLNNLGTINWSGAGAILCDGRPAYGMNPCVINNLAGGSFRMLTDGNPFTRFGNYSTFNNAVGATFVKAGGTNQTVIDNFIFNNAGEVRAETGTLTFSDIANFSSNSVVNATSLIRFSGNVAATNRLTVAGTVRIDGGTFSALADSTNTTMRWNGPGVLEWCGGTIAGNTTMSSNMLVKIYNSDGANVTKVLGSAAVLNNEGIIDWAEPGTILCDGRPGYGLSPGVINNRSGGQFRLLSDGTPFTRNGDMSTFNNELGGLFVKVGGTNEAFINSFVFNNLGEIRNTSGTLTFNENLNLQSGCLVNGSNLVRIAGTVTATNEVNLRGVVRLDGGGITASGNPSLLMKGPAVFEWAGGSIGGNATVTSNLTMNVATPNAANIMKVLASAAVLNNEGVVTWTGPGTIFSDGRPAYGQLPSVFNNRSGAQFRMLTDGQVFQRYGDYSFFNNESGALLEKSGGTNTTLVTAFTLNNFGEVRATMGTIEYNEQVVAKPGSTFGGPGAHQFSAGTLSLHGTTTANNTAVNLAGVYVNAVVSSNATIATTANGSFNWSGGTLGGDLTIAPGGVMNLTGSTAKTFDSAAVLRNNGTIHWTGGDIFSDGRPVYGMRPATINNEAGALFSVENDAYFAWYNPGHVFNNKSGAVFRKTIATGTTIVNWTFNNSGTIDLQNGSVSLEDRVLNSGGSVRVALKGTSATTEFGVLNLSGVATLQGALTVVTTNGYVPVENDSFSILNYGSRSGQFAPVILPALTYPLQWKVSYSGTAFTLKVEKAHVLQAPTFNGAGQAQIALTGPSSAAAILESSTNLVDWTAILTNTPFSGVFNFVDPQTANAKSKFYRIQVVP